MQHKYIAFDLETAKVQVPNLKDWMADRPLGISCAATYADGANGPVLWHGGTRHTHPATKMKVEQARASWSTIFVNTYVSAIRSLLGME